MNAFGLHENRQNDMNFLNQKALELNVHFQFYPCSRFHIANFAYHVAPDLVKFIVQFCVTTIET